jgi:hypothetical protein
MHRNWSVEALVSLGLLGAILVTLVAILISKGHDRQLQPNREPRIGRP